MQTFGRISLLAIWILCLLFNAAFAVPSDGANQEQQSGSDEPQEMICHPGKTCYPKYFVPTTTFVAVESDQVVPRGLHIRLNIGTGGREAKIIDPTEDEGTAVYVEKEKKIQPPVMEYSDLVVVSEPEGEESDVLNLGGHNGSQPEGDTKLRQVPQPLKPNPHLSTEDWATFNAAVSALATATSGSELEDALQILSDISHEPEYGVKLIETSLEKLLEIITGDKYTTVSRSNAAIAFGNSLQNNAVALDSVRKLHRNDAKAVIFQPLLDTLLKNNDIILERRLMFALSRTVRIHKGKEDFISLKGLSTLRQVYTSTSDLTLRGKISAFIQDEFLDDEMTDTRHFEYVGGSAGNSQKVIRIKDELGSGWCNILQDDLTSRDASENKDLDSEQKVLVTLTGLRKKYGDKCTAKDAFRAWLEGEKKRVGTDSDDDWIKVSLEEADGAFFRTTNA